MKIHFFGGYRASSQDVLAWCKSLEQKQPHVVAIGWPYPIGSSAGDPLKRWNYSDSLAKFISVDSDESLIVGHSSGCAIANDVADKTLALGARNFRLIALDGFRPKPELLNVPGTMLWSADSNGIHSLNYDALKDTAKFHVYRAAVRKKWPLHFSLVNLNASDDFDGITQGYHNCDANVEVLSLGAAEIA